MSEWAYVRIYKYPESALQKVGSILRNWGWEELCYYDEDDGEFTDIDTSQFVSQESANIDDLADELERAGCTFWMYEELTDGDYSGIINVPGVGKWEGATDSEGTPIVSAAVVVDQLARNPGKFELIAWLEEAFALPLQRILERM